MNLNVRWFLINQTKRFSDGGKYFPIAAPTHLAFLPTREREVSLSFLLTPGTPRQRVAHDGVGVALVVEAGVEVHGDVVGVVADVEGEAARTGSAEVMSWRRNCTRQRSGSVRVRAGLTSSSRPWA